MNRLFSVSGLVAVLICVGLAPVQPVVAGWEPHVVEQLNGASPRIKSPARIQIVSRGWKLGAVHYPYLVQLPKKNRLIMLVNWGTRPENRSGITVSDDGGNNWSRPKQVVDTWSVGLSRLSDGQLILVSQSRVTGPSSRYLFSRDHGETWAESVAAPGYRGDKPFYEDSQFLVDRDASGRVTRLWGTGKAPGKACLVRHSDDGGRTWSRCRHVPEWGRTGEIVLHRAANGHLLAACRTNLERFVAGKIDHWSGLGVTRSEDSGRTWSKMDYLYAWGRHMSSLVTMPNGHIVLTYVVRKGYTPDADGVARFGIEAIVSRDHGKTWDLDHRYLLVTWKGDASLKEAWRASGQRTGTVLLRDESLVTAFGAWYRNIVVVRWRLHDAKLSPSTRIAESAFDSKLRNVFDPAVSRYARTDPGEPPER